MIVICAHPTQAKGMIELVSLPADTVTTEIGETLRLLDCDEGVTGLIIYYAREGRDAVNLAIRLCLALELPVIVLHSGIASQVPPIFEAHGVDSDFRDAETWIADVRRRLNLPELPTD